MVSGLGIEMQTLEDFIDCLSILPKIYMGSHTMSNLKHNKKCNVYYEKMCTEKMQNMFSNYRNCIWVGYRNLQTLEDFIDHLSMLPKSIWEVIQ